MIDTIKLNELLYQGIKNAIYESIDIEYPDFKIVVYSKNSDNDANFIRNHRNVIQQFLVDGYKAAGYKTFKGCSDANSLVRNYTEIKIAYHNEEMIAVSVYSGYLNGFKCVGLTATTNQELRKIGVQAVHEIIKRDIRMFENFYWIECGDKIEELYAKYGGIPIPSIYFEQIFCKKKLIEIERDEDGFHYTRIIDNEPVRKIIYGFNNKNTFNGVLDTYKKYISNHIEEIDKDFENWLVESINNTRAYDIALTCWNNIIVFFEAWNCGLSEHLPEDRKILEDSTRLLERYIELHSEDIPEEMTEQFHLAVENGKAILASGTILEYHCFE